MEPDHLARICEAFALGTPITIEEDHEGVLNRNFDLVTDTGRYFIKSVRDRRRDAIPVIAASEQFMAESGVPAVCMLRTTSGELFLPHEAEVYTVYPYIPHVAPTEAPFAALGTMLARIHFCGDGPLPTLLQDIVMTERPLERVQQKLTTYLERAKSGTEAMDERFRTYISRKLELLPSLPVVPESKRTLVHGDYHTRNILFDEAREIQGICDWEKTELAPRAYELARSVQVICFEGWQTEHSYDTTRAVENARSFISAYREKYPIGNEELRNGFALRLRKLVMAFWIEEAHYDRFDTRSDKFVANETRLLSEFTDPQLVESHIN